MDVDGILNAFNNEGARYLLIGGMNFYLRHEHVATFDVDLWIDDTPENKTRASRALSKLEAEWGRTEADWKPVAPDGSWLRFQSCFCLTTAYGAVDIFLRVDGLEDGFEACMRRAVAAETFRGVKFMALADADMIRCQEALPEAVRKLDRIRTLKSKSSNGPSS